MNKLNLFNEISINDQSRLVDAYNDIQELQNTERVTVFWDNGVTTITEAGELRRSIEVALGLKRTQ